MNLTIQQIEIPVSSIEHAKDFYVNKLGLQIIEENEAIQLLALVAGNVRLSIFGGFKAVINRDLQHVGTHIVLSTDDIEKAFSALKGNSIIFDKGIVEVPGFLKYISTNDPDGNVIEIAEYLRDPLKPKPVK